jgi:hypothetical protein
MFDAKRSGDQACLEKIQSVNLKAGHRIQHNPGWITTKEISNKHLDI